MRVGWDGGWGGSTPFCWGKANQVSALIWVSVLSFGDPPGIQLLSHHPIHLLLRSASGCVRECARQHVFSLIHLEVGKMSALNILIVLKFSLKISPWVQRINMKAICCCDKEFYDEGERGADFQTVWFNYGASSKITDIFEFAYYKVSRWLLHKPSSWSSRLFPSNAI